MTTQTNCTIYHFGFFFFLFLKKLHFTVCVSLRQVKELEQILKSRNPNSLPALIYAVANADKQNEASPPSSINALLERRIQHLEAELESHEEEAKRSMRAMEQQFQRIKVTSTLLQMIICVGFWSVRAHRCQTMCLFLCCTVFSSATSSRSPRWRNSWNRSSSSSSSQERKTPPLQPGPRLSLWRRSCSGKRKLTWRKRLPSRNRWSPSGCSSNKRFVP